MMNDDTHDKITILTADIVAAYVSKNPLPATNVGQLIADVHSALAGLGTATAAAPVLEAPKPAMSQRASVTPDAIYCLDCAKRFKSLKRHLMSHHNLTPEQYRERFGLKPDYPMVAPNYSATRSSLAKANGLGRAHATH